MAAAHHPRTKAFGTWPNLSTVRTSAEWLVSSLRLWRRPADGNQLSARMSVGPPCCRCRVLPYFRPLDYGRRHGKGNPSHTFRGAKPYSARQIPPSRHRQRHRIASCRSSRRTLLIDFKNEEAKRPWLSNIDRPG